MRITIIAPTEIPARRANSIQVMKMTQAFASLDHDVHLVVPQNLPEAKIEAETSGRTIDAQRIGWEYLAKFYGLRKQFPITYLAARPIFRRYDFSMQAVLWARRRKSDLIYTRLPQAATLSAILGASTVFELHDLPQGSAGPTLFRQFLKSRGASRLVVITSALAHDLAKKYGSGKVISDLIIAPDGVDLERYENTPNPQDARALLRQKLPDQFPPSFERFTAGYTGHLYLGRGADIIIKLAQRLPGINFLIAGGEEQDLAKLRKEVAELNPANIYVTGFIPNSELPLYQAACDVLLMPYQEKVAASSGGDISHYLSPMKLFEYLACGRPIISSNLPVFTEVLNEYNALFLDGAEVESWAKLLIELQGNSERRSKLAAQALRDAQKYTWEKRARIILEGTLSNE